LLALGSKLPGATETGEEMRPMCIRESLNPAGLIESWMHHAKPKGKREKESGMNQASSQTQRKRGLVVEEGQVLVCGSIH